MQFKANFIASGNEILLNYHQALGIRFDFDGRDDILGLTPYVDDDDDGVC